jgi:Mrp family chromosome partitioning ATPase
MSRVYSALTGAARPLGGAVVLDAPDDGAWENSDEPAPDAAEAAAAAAPFIEIGGPGGPVCSPGLGSAPAPRALGEIKPDLKLQTKVDEATGTFPRLAPLTNAAHLSVRFHDLAARTAAANPGGPDASLVAFHLPNHPASGEYRAVRDAILKQLPEAPARVLAFTAAAAQSGTTTVLLNIATTLAAQEKARVLVVDAAVKRPAVAAKLGLRPAPGLCEVLAGRLPVTLAVQPTAVQRLDALAAGDPTDGTPGSLGREFPRLLGQLRNWYGWVLVDGGTWGTMPERDGTCPNADAVYLVSRDTLVDRHEFVAVRGWVKELGGLLRGYVTTKV